MEKEREGRRKKTRPSAHQWTEGNLLLKIYIFSYFVQNETHFTRCLVSFPKVSSVLG